MTQWSNGHRRTPNSKQTPQNAKWTQTHVPQMNTQTTDPPPPFGFAFFRSVPGGGDVQRWQLCQHKPDTKGRPPNSKQTYGADVQTCPPGPRGRDSAPVHPPPFPSHPPSDDDGGGGGDSLHYYSHSVAAGATLRLDAHAAAHLQKRFACL